MQARKRRGTRSRNLPWYVQYREPDGRQKRPGFATKAEADAWIRKNAPKLHARKQLVPLVPSDSTVAVYGRRWLADVEAGIKARSHEHYASHFARYVLPALGPRRVADLTRPEI